MKKLLVALCFICLAHFIDAQEIVVQTLNYDSETRDTLIQFPEVDHNNWEKIIMKYSMRCKDGLVSPAISGQTNIGCGEWDYSCNTYITDSTKVDSLRTVSPDFEISNFSGDAFAYSENPTYQYYISNLYEVEALSVSNEVMYPLIQSNETLDLLAGNGDTKRFSFEWKKADLFDAGLSEGNIDAIGLNIDSGSGTFRNFKIRMRHGIDGTDFCFYQNDWQEVYYNHTEFNSNFEKILLHTPFDWNGIDDIQLDISYEVINSTVALSSLSESNPRIYSASNNKVWVSNGVGQIRIVDDFSTIDKEISIAFWTKGADVLPVNTFFLEGVDQDDNRQVNIHLPWNNGQMYWDCGNDGSGYDRINKAATTDQIKNTWNHWVYIKDANTGIMRIYLNGGLWHEGTSKTKAIDLDVLVIGSSSNFNTPYFGEIDELCIWDKALSPAEVRANHCGFTSAQDENLILRYDFENLDAINDLSPAQNDGEVIGDLHGYDAFPRDFNFYNGTLTSMPDIFPIKGEYDLNVVALTSMDSIQNAPHRVDAYGLNGTDRVLENTMYYYPAGDMSVFNEDGSIHSTISIDPDGVITIGEMVHFTKSPMQFELMSFVTPYGINLDLGWEGKTWTFDVTDYAPLLKGSKRMYMSRGGQWQEDIDIKFLFYEGTPPRNVHSVDQVWPVTNTGWQAIMDDRRFEPRAQVKTAGDAAVVFKTVITGHGQEGEFIPRNHFISIDEIPVQWQVWKECSENPIQPQGGTWVYDRAGWCPGMPSDIRLNDFTGIMQNDVPVMIDYGIQSVAGNSNYIVNTQVIKYGEVNHTHDAAIDAIINPSGRIEYGQFNPRCSESLIRIQNRGAQNLTNATIEYGVDGGEVFTQEWEGNLSFLATDEIILRYMPSVAAANTDQLFYAKIITPNDEYPSNDVMVSDYQPVDEVDSNVMIRFKTNNNATSTGYKVYNEYDEVIFSKGPSGLSANTTYEDVLNVNGCYRLVVTDSGQDGLEWWANLSQGSGFIQVLQSDGSFKELPRDFGAFFEYHFIAGMVTDTESFDTEEFDINIYPNPSTHRVHVVLKEAEKVRNISVLHLSGREIQRVDLESAEIHNVAFDLSQLSQGIYLIRVEGEQGVVTKKLIKS